MAECSGYKPLMAHNRYENKKNNSFQLEMILALFKKNESQIKKEFIFNQINVCLISKALKDPLYKTEVNTKPTECSWKLKAFPFLFSTTTTRFSTTTISR